MARHRERRTLLSLCRLEDRPMCRSFVRGNALHRVVVYNEAHTLTCCFYIYRLIPSPGSSNSDLPSAGTLTPYLGHWFCFPQDDPERHMLYTHVNSEANTALRYLDLRFENPFYIHHLPAYIDRRIPRRSPWRKLFPLPDISPHP